MRSEDDISITFRFYYPVPPNQMNKIPVIRTNAVQYDRMRRDVDLLRVRWGRAGRGSSVGHSMAHTMLFVEFNQAFVLCLYTWTPVTCPNITVSHI